MADKFINELPVASLLTDAGLLVVYQDGKTQSIRGELIKQYAAQGVSQYVEEAKTAAQTAGDAAGEAQAAAEEAKGVALYPPQVNPETGMWQTWDAAQQQYVDTDQKAEGPEGPAGSSIQSIERTSGTGAPGTTDTYTVTLTNGSTTTFQVYNGADGAGTGDFKADGSVPMTGALQMAGHTISGLPAPVADSDPVRKQDVPTLAADRQLSNLDTPQAALVNLGGADRKLSNLATDQAALVNLGAGVRPNLLINGDFLVNQLGKTEYGTSQNAMDRWETTAGVSSLIVQQGYVTVTQNTTGGAVDQYLPDTVHFEQGETLTLSALVRGSSGKAGIQHGIGEYGPTVLVDLSEEWTLATTTFTVPSGDKKQVRFRSNLAGQTFDTLAVKLERGPNQTLAYKDNAGKWRLLPQPESDYDTALQKCQAYQLYFKNNAQSESYGIFVGVGYGHTENIARILLFTPVTLYGAVSGFKPTVTFNDLYIDGIGGTKQVTNIAVPFIPSENGVVLSCTVSETLTVGQFYILRLGQNGELLVDSN